MKFLKFRSYLADQILDGSKTVTWRLFDDKDFQVGDQAELIRWETEEVFAKAEIVEIKQKKLGEVQGADFEGHETYKDTDDMLEHYKQYYGDKVTLDTIVKMIKFKLL